MICSLFRRTVLMLSLAVTLGCFYSPGLYSQTSGLTSQRLDYVIPTPGLPVFPELHTDMTLEAFIGYVYLDSIARTIGIESAIAGPDNMSTQDLRAISRYIYGVGDYNPILLLRHFTSTADSSFPNARYASYPANTYFNLLRAIHERNDFGKEYTLLVVSAYALHVRVTAVTSGMDTTFRSPMPWTNIACEIIESFKGKVPPNNNCSTPLQSKEKTDNTLASPGCVVFGQQNYTPNRQIPKVGDEFIVFLYLEPFLEGNARLIPLVGEEPNNGIFRIIDGKVQDTGNVWGLGTTPSFTSFRSNLLGKISTIKNWTR